MRKKMVLGGVALAVMGCSSNQYQATTSAKTGEELFYDRCAACHPNGGNVLNPQKTLQKIDREARGIRTPEDIVRTMRNPGPGMTRFTPDLLSDADARKIAEYVITTYK